MPTSAGSPCKPTMKKGVPVTEEFVCQKRFNTGGDRAWEMVLDFYGDRAFWLLKHEVDLFFVCSAPIRHCIGPISFDQLREYTVFKDGPSNSVCRRFSQIICIRPVS